jgi:hypothetical protein
VSFTSRPLYPRERAPGTHWIGGWVGPRAGLDAVVKRKIPNPCQDSNPRSYSPWPSSIPPQLLIQPNETNISCYIYIYTHTHTHTHTQYPGIFLLTPASRTALGPNQPLIQWVPGALSLGVKRPGREADHSPPSGAEVKNAWSCISTPPVHLRGVVLR